MDKNKSDCGCLSYVSGRDSQHLMRTSQPDSSSNSNYLFLYLGVTTWIWLLFYTQGVTGKSLISTKAATITNTNISKVEDASNFHIYYGQSFKVIKSALDSMSYLLIQLLGLLGSLKGITNEDSIVSQCVLKLCEGGDVEMINRSEPQQFQQFAANFISSIDETYACNFATFVPSSESTPLQRAEWIKYLGVFTNLEDRANLVYDKIKENYICLTKIAASKATLVKPTVAWMEYNNGIWSFTKEVFKFKYVEDAGGENIDKSINKYTYNTSNPEDLDELHAILCTVDVVIDETRAPDPSGYTVSTFLKNVGIEDNSCFSFLSNQSMWRHDKRLANATKLDWSDGAISQPQLVLADLIQALFSTENYTTTYFRNFSKEEGVVSINSTMCDRNSSTAMQPTIIPCK